MTNDDLLAQLAIVASFQRMNQRGTLAFAGLEDYLLARGRAWAVSPAQSYPRNVAVHYKQCFGNALRVARRYPRKYRYVEGLACGVIPVHHAWCVDRDDLVHDPTWAKFSTPGTAYFGVEIPVATAAAIQTPECMSVISHWPSGFPLLQL